MAEDYVSKVAWQTIGITRRLKVLRHTRKFTQEGMSAHLGLVGDKTDTYGKAERTGNIGGIVHRIWQTFEGIDAGWIYQGLTGNVPSHVRKRLDEAYFELWPPTRPKPRSRPKRNNR